MACVLRCVWPIVLYNVAVYDIILYYVLQGISVTAPIRRSTPWVFIRKNFPFVPTTEMSTLFSFPSKNQLNAQGAVTENPGIYAMCFILSRNIISEKL